MHFNVNIYEKLNIQAYLGEVLFNTIFEKKTLLSYETCMREAMPSTLYRYRCFSHRRLLVGYRVRLFFNKKKNGIYSC